MQRHAIILQPFEPNNMFEVYLHAPNQSDKIKFLKGNPMLMKDLSRAATGQATAAILLADRN